MGLPRRLSPIPAAAQSTSITITVSGTWKTASAVVAAVRLDSPRRATLRERIAAAFQLGHQREPAVAGSRCHQQQPTPRQLCPTTLPYLLHVAVLVAGLAVLVRVPETVHTHHAGRRRAPHGRLTLTARLAPPHTRGAMNSAFYAFAYAGFGTPLLLAWAGASVGTVVAMSWFTDVPVAIAAWLFVDVRRAVHD